MNNFGIFAQHPISSRTQLVLNDGIRLQSINLKSNVLDTIPNLPDTAVTQNSFSRNRQISALYNPTASTTIKTSSASAPAPNIDDPAKIFESSTAACQVVVPNADIKPEYTYNFDLTINQRIANRVSIELIRVLYPFRNAILKSSYKLKRPDSIIYNGIKSQVLASQNVSKANVYGFSGGVDADITKGLSFSTTLSYTKGLVQNRSIQNPTIYESSRTAPMFVSTECFRNPLDHIPPVFGKTSVRYQHKRFGPPNLSHIYINGWKRLDDFNADEKIMSNTLADGNAPDNIELAWL